MNIADLSMINGPLFKTVKFVETSVERNVADEVERLARVTTAGSWKNGITTSLQATTCPWYGV
jgi:hypothetical protein